MSRKLKIGFLGGTDEIGKNMTIFECGQDIIVIDCGMGFPSNDETPGIDFIIPDYQYLKDNQDRVRAVFITHGHEDHIGGLPYLLKDINVPVYGSSLALGIIQQKLSEAMVTGVQLNAVSDRQEIEVGRFKVEFVRVTHSTAGSYALCITTPKGVVFMTGDFKIDHTPTDGVPTDLARIAEIGKKGVLLLMMDSTNVERQGYSMSEASVCKALEQQFAMNKDKRIIVATFASNVHRVQQIINCAVKNGRKVAFVGRSLINISEIAKTLGELKYNDDDIIDIDKFGKIPHDRLCIISTGTQGEPMSALTRMSTGKFRNITISEQDCVLLSSSPIPGNEKLIYNVINNLCKKGANVVYRALDEIHASGHAFQEELKLMFRLINPTYFIPVHGEYRHLKLHKELVVELGMKPANVFLPEQGFLIEVEKSGIKKGQAIPYGKLMLDGAVAVENEFLLRDRKQIGEDGFLIAIVDRTPNEDGLYNKPIIITRGINVTEEYKEDLGEELLLDMNGGLVDDIDGPTAKQILRKLLAKKLFAKLKKRPMVLPIILD
ncbi:MAG: ribonuclease J [Clostridiales bacterium]|nr:ribonuclease J [Clostridiales bacterium]